MTTPTTTSVVVVTMTLDPGRTEDVDAHFHRDVVPYVVSRPGFVSGRWLRSVDGSRGLGLLVFDTGEHAEAAAEGPRRASRDEDRAWNIERVEVFDEVTSA